ENEVWKYDRNIRGTPSQIFRITFGRGMAIGFGLAVLTTIVGKLIEDKPHGHDEGHHYCYFKAGAGRATI
ncbi:hypothetical protein Ocin01_02789, partial [Orchesella cincta]